MFRTIYHSIELIIYTLLNKRGLHWFLWDLCDLTALEESLLFKVSNYLLNKVYADTYWNA
jgi:hypothetical protein